MTIPTPSPAGRGQAPRTDPSGRPAGGDAAAVAEVVGNIAREIGGPLTAIEMAVDRLRGSDSPTGGPGASELRIILDQSHRLAGLARTLLSLAGPSRSTPRPIALNDLVRELGAMVRGDLECRGVTLEVRTSPTEPGVAGDPHQLRECLVSVIHNARIAIETEERSGIIRVSTGSQSKHTSFIRIEDTGPGVPEGQEDRIFLPFVSTWGREGVGLALARLALLGQGGDLHVASSPKLGGAAFTILLPSTLPEGPER
jgi:two-component system, NtrC family, sensor histidine kinase HydH